MRLVLERPGIGPKELRIAMRAALGSCSNDRTDAAVDFLGKAIRREKGLRLAEHLFVEVEHLPHELQSTATEPGGPV